MKKQEEGIFYDKRHGEWVVTDRWPKGKSRARFIAVRNGTTSAPFGDDTLSVARAKVEEWMTKDKAFNLGYERFVIIPMAANEMTPEVKARLRKLAADRKKPAVDDSVEAPAAEAFIRNEKKRERREKKSYDRRS